MESDKPKKTIFIETYDHRDLINTKHFLNQGMKWKKKHIEIEEETYEFLKSIMEGSYSNVRISLDNDRDGMSEYGKMSWKHVLLH